MKSHITRTPLTKSLAEELALLKTEKLEACGARPAGVESIDLVTLW